MSKASEEFEQRNSEYIAAHRNEAGYEGVYARLIERFNPSAIGEWVVGEADRDSNREDMLEAVSGALALSIICACGAIGGPIKAARQLVMHSVALMLIEMMSGEIEAGVVVVDLEKGTEHEATIEGLHKRHPFQPRKVG